MDNSKLASDPKPEKNTPFLAGGLSRMSRVLDRVVDVLAYGSGSLFLLCAIYITLDAVGRKFGFFTRVSDEMSGYVLVAGTAFSMAYCMKIGGHIRIDVIFPYLPRRVKGILDLVSLALMCLFAILICVYSWRLALRSYAIKTAAISFLHTPLFIPQGIMAIGFGLFALEAVVVLGVRVARLVAAARSRRVSLSSGVSPQGEPPISQRAEQ